MMSLWDALRMNMMISYQELVRTFPNWVTISDVKANNVKVNYETIMIAPLESQSVNVKSNNANNWYLTIIDDHGNYISDKI